MRTPSHDYKVKSWALSESLRDHNAWTDHWGWEKPLKTPYDLTNTEIAILRIYDEQPEHILSPKKGYAIQGPET